MKRWRFNIFAALSLLLVVATTTLWVRSLSQTDLLVFTVGPAFCQLCSQDSTI